MNVLISVTEDYLQYAEIMLFSLHRHTEENVDVYLFHHGIESQKLAGFAKHLNKKCKMQLFPIRIDGSLFLGLPLGNQHFSKPEMFDRLLAQYFLPQTMDRILWLDVDIIVLKNISAFYSQPFGNGIKYIVCQDVNDGKPIVQDCKLKLGMALDKPYFNSGVLLMNLVELRKGPSIDSFLLKCESHADELTLPDQDLLNVIYQNEVVFVDSTKFNYQLAGRELIDKKQKDNIHILHYTTSQKPWKFAYVSSSSKPYWHTCFLYGMFFKTFFIYFKKICSYQIDCFRKIKHLFWG